MGFLTGLLICPLFAHFFLKLLIRKVFFYIFVHCVLIFLQCQNIIRSFLPDFSCARCLRSHCINRNDLTLYLDFFQQLWNRCYFIAFFFDCFLSQTKSIFLTPCRNNVTCFFFSTFIRTHRFSIYADDLLQQFSIIFIQPLLPFSIELLQNFGRYHPHDTPDRIMRGDSVF